MSDCRCSGAPGQNDTWDYHSDYCPVYMQGRIVELEQQLAALREATKDPRFYELSICDNACCDEPAQTGALICPLCEADVAALLQESSDDIR